MDSVWPLVLMLGTGVLATFLVVITGRTNRQWVVLLLCAERNKAVRGRAEPQRVVRAVARRERAM